MKRKGFTLIELIVVIAIIGVLAAILVPAMLGFVKKAKITTANAEAREVANTINAIVADDAQSDNFSTLADGDYGFKCDVGVALETVTDDANKPISDYMDTYSDALTGGNFAVYIKGGVVVAAATKNGKYYGTYPAVLSNKNYDEKLSSYTMEAALNLAKAEVGITSGNDNTDDTEVNP